MACHVCSGEERFLLADFQTTILMGYIDKPESIEDREVPPALDIYEIPSPNAPGVVKPSYHAQVIAHCPICGKQLCSDELKEEVLQIYTFLHEQHVSMRNGSWKDGFDEVSVAGSETPAMDETGNESKEREGEENNG